MAQSQIAKRIATIVSVGLSRQLKAKGFRTRGIHSYKRNHEVIQVIDVQSSRGHILATGRFRLNVGIHFPRVAKVLLGVNPMPEVPQEPYCILRRMFSPDRPDLRGWWTVNPETNVQALAEELTAHWRNDARPWIEKNKRLSEAAKTLEDQQHLWPAAAAMLVLGHPQEASRLLRAYVLNLRTFSEANHPANARFTTKRLQEIQRWALLHHVMI